MNPLVTKKWNILYKTIAEYMSMVFLVYPYSHKSISSNEDISKIMFNVERECLVIYMFILSN